MRYLLILACSLGMADRCTAQIVMNLQLPPAGIVLKDQLWNMSLVNTGADHPSVQLQMSLTEINSNQTVMSAVTRIFSLAKGVSMIRAADVGPIYTAGTSSYPVDNNPNGFLPVGIFNACFTLVDVDPHRDIQTVEECVTVEVEPVSPPMLVFPGDQEKLDISRPVFMWTPPAPVSLFSNLKYLMSLVEVMPAQSPADAIAQNIPLFVSMNINLPNIPYPSTLLPLDTGKIYAWQVKALNNELPVATSEIWTFRVATEQAVSKNKRSGFYVKLSRKEDSAPVDTYGALQYQYDNEANDTVVSIHLYDITQAHRIEMPLSSAAQTISFGANYRVVPFSGSRSLKDHHIYLLELRNASEEHWYAKFVFHKSK